MSNTKYTPGPWSINEWPQSSTDIAIGAVGTPLIAKVPLRDVSINEQKANSALIAAAPDLLDALIAFRDSGPQGGKNFAEWHQSYWPAIELARSAIAKAQGEEQ